VNCEDFTLHDISLIPVLGLGYNLIFFVLHVLEDKLLFCGECGSVSWCVVLEIYMMGVAM
jgi:hypothetical protein